MRKKQVLCMILIVLNFGSVSVSYAQTAVKGDDGKQETTAGKAAETLANQIYDARILDRRIPLLIDVTDHVATVVLSVSRTTPSFEIDSKTAALAIAKVIMDFDQTITSTLVQFKSAKSSEYNEVLVGGGEISAYNAGRKSRDELLNSLELNTMILVDQPQPSDAKNRIRPESANFSNPADSVKPSSGNSFALVPNDVDTIGSITSEIPIPPVGTNPYFDQRSEPKKPRFKPINAKDKYFSTGRVAFFYPPNWVRRRVSRNDWATPDEQDIAEFACKTRIGEPLISLSRFVRIRLEERLSNEAMVGFAFGLEVQPSETVMVGYRHDVAAKSILSTGREGLIYFKRVYFKDGFDLYALTLKCKVAEAAPLEQDLARILSTLHSPRVDSPSTSKKRGANTNGNKLKPDDAKTTPEKQTFPSVPLKPDVDKPKELPAPKDTEMRARPTA